MTLDKQADAHIQVTWHTDSCHIYQTTRESIIQLMAGRVGMDALDVAMYYMDIHHCNRKYSRDWKSERGVAMFEHA